MDPRIAHVITHMEANLTTAPGISELAALAELSPSRFAHLFRDEVGVPPARYLHRLRMQRARVLLEGSFVSVREAMRQVGFRDPSHFARDFRRYHGFAPSALRSRTNGPGRRSPALLDDLITVDTAVAHDAGVYREKVGDPVKPRPPE